MPIPSRDIQFGKVFVILKIIRHFNFTKIIIISDCLVGNTSFIDVKYFQELNKLTLGFFLIP